LLLALAAALTFVRPGAARMAEGTSEEHAALLDSLQRKAVEFFWQEAPPETGQVKDRARGDRKDRYTVSSIASTGFGLAALGIGAERGWIPRQAAEERAVRTLRFLRYRMPHEHGWYYHFVDRHTGLRAWKCELSSIDTALLLSGALVSAAAFPSGEAPRLVDQIYRRVDFPWMLTDGGTKPKETTLSMGWKPESGFLKSRWDHYCELMILYLLGLGSPTHPLPAACWDAWRRPVTTYKEYRGVALELPLFVHQYSHAFVDFRGLRDRRGFDPWQNSVVATRMNRQFCIDHAERHRGYGENSWGLSACDGPDGYRAYAPKPGEHDGTITPWVVAASLPFAPEICLPALAAMRAEADLWGGYGFTDAFNRDRSWVDPDVIGIDLGAALLMIENHRTGRIWKQFMSHASIRTALRRAGLKRGAMAPEKPFQPVEALGAKADSHIAAHHGERLLRR
jgi:hypothetical protein